LVVRAGRGWSIKYTCLRVWIGDKRVNNSNINHNNNTTLYKIKGTFAIRKRYLPITTPQNHTAAYWRSIDTWDRTTLPAVHLYAYTYLFTYYINIMHNINGRGRTCDIGRFPSELYIYKKYVITPQCRANELYTHT